MFRTSVFLIVLAMINCNWYRYPDLEYFHVNSNQKANVIFLGGPDDWAGNRVYLSQDWEVLGFANTYSLSLPNQGHSFALSSPTLDILASVVSDFILRLGLSNVYLFGDYLGGKVAMQVAALYPQLVDGLFIQNSLPFAYPQSFINSEKRLYTNLAALNLKRKLADIKPELRAILGSDVYLAFILAQLQGSEGDYFLPFNLQPFIRNIQNLSGAVTRRTFKGPVKVLNSNSAEFGSKSQNAQLKWYYPNINLGKDVVYVDQEDYVGIESRDLQVSMLRDLICH